MKNDVRSSLIHIAMCQNIQSDNFIVKSIITFISGLIVPNSKKSLIEFQGSASHEFGHALGLLHKYVGSDIMNELKVNYLDGPLYRDSMYILEFYDPSPSFTLKKPCSK